MVDRRYYANNSDREHFMAYINTVIDKYIPKDEYINFGEINTKIFNDFDIQEEFEFDISVFDYLILKEELFIETNGNLTQYKDEITYQGRYNFDHNTYFICDFNIERLFAKSDAQDFDWDREIKRIADALQSSTDYNHNRLYTLYQLGELFFKHEYFEKAAGYFSWISSENYSLSEATVSEVYKEIGELYKSIKDFSSAKKWFEKGLEINPKLAVKKILKGLQ